MNLFVIMLLASVPLSDVVGRSISSAPPDSCSHAKAAFDLAEWRAETEGLKNIDDPESEKTDVRHYRLDFEIDPVAQTLAGTTVMTVASRIDDLSSFRFWLNASMAIDGVEVDGESVEWQRSDGAVVDVDLNHSFDPGELFEVSVGYHGTPVTPGIFQNRDDGSPVISTLSQPWYSSDWWPVKDDNSDKATGELLITVPSELSVVSNGVVVAIDPVPGGRRRFHWSTEYPTSPYLFAFAATVYNEFSATLHSDGGSMPVDFFIYPERDTAANRGGWLLSVDMLSIFEELFGTYPFIDEKYAIYQFPFGGGMEHQTATGQGGNHAFDETLTAHEAAHQWWGDMVTCATWNDIWLNEGFATYSAALWYEHRSGTRIPEALHDYMNDVRPTALAGTVYVYDISDPSRIFSGNYSYRKGAWVLHMLRGVVGYENFLKILDLYRERYEYSSADTEDFREVAEEVWGNDLGWFFDQWIYGGGAPAYRSYRREYEVSGQRYLEIAIEQSQNEAVFTMPVRIQTLESGQIHDYTVWNDARAQYFLIPVSAAVDGLDIDPDDWILTRLVSTGYFPPGPPKLVAVDPAPSSVLRAGEPLSMTLRFHKDVVVDGADIILRGSDGDAYDLAVTYDADTLTATVTSHQPLAGGSYELTVSDAIVDAADGLAFDGEMTDTFGERLMPSGDGVEGGSAVIRFGVSGSRRPTARRRLADESAFLPALPLRVVCTGGTRHREGSSLDVWCGPSVVNLFDDSRDQR
jgi:aminopeptidase N